MELDPLQPAIKEEILTPIVRDALHDESVDVIEWQCQPIQGGTVGQVYRLKGKGRIHPHDSSVDTRCELIPWSLILKVQKQWARNGDPECWRREMLLYRSGLFDEHPSSLTVPRCLSLVERKPDEIWLWLEEVTGQTGTQMSLEDYGLAARHLAHLQGRYLMDRSLPSYPWLSTRRWVANTVSNWGTGALPWLQSHRPESSSDRVFPSEVIHGLLHLWAERDEFLDQLDTVPRTLCHRDFNAANLFVRGGAGEGGQTTAIDWDCAGIGTIGEDIADLVGEALVFFAFDPTQARVLKETVLSGYLAGLRDVGWRGDPQRLRLGYAVNSPLQWCFRIACRAQDTDDQEMKERYIEVQRFMLDLADEARNLLSGI